MSETDDNSAIRLCNQTAHLERYTETFYVEHECWFGLKYVNNSGNIWQFIDSSVNTSIYNYTNWMEEPSAYINDAYSWCGSIVVARDESDGWGWFFEVCTRFEWPFVCNYQYSLPTPIPTTVPTPSPTPSPTTVPTAAPTSSPTPGPTLAPTSPPTPSPTPSPSASPTFSSYAFF